MNSLRHYGYLNGTGCASHLSVSAKSTESSHEVYH